MDYTALQLLRNFKELGKQVALLFERFVESDIEIVYLAKKNNANIDGLFRITRIIPSET